MTLDLSTSLEDYQQQQHTTPLKSINFISKIQSLGPLFAYWL